MKSIVSISVLISMIKSTVTVIFTNAKEKAVVR